MGGGGLFGAAAPTPAGGLFGATPPAPAGGGGLFGSMAPTPAPGKDAIYPYCIVLFCNYLWVDYSLTN